MTGSVTKVLQCYCRTVSGNRLIDACEERGERAEPDAASAPFETPSEGATVWSTGREGQAHAPEGSPHGAGF